MSVTPRLCVIDDPRYQNHQGPREHPERPERLVAVGRALEAFEPYLDRLAPRSAEPEEILRVHEADHLVRVREAALQGSGRMDADTYVSTESFEVARLAAGGAIDLARAVARGQANSGIAAVRPPGHHAESDAAMGFCLFNNVAIAARALQEEDGVGKILILDWDVHHGNGTQHSFVDNDSVLYVSTHQFPFYPGTGAAHEAGFGRAEGTTVNVPMPAGCGDAEYLGVFLRILEPIARHFAPEMILVSCGFDAHADDPLGSMNISASGFLVMTRIVRALAHELCGDRVAFILEGGYSPLGLHEGMSALLTGMTEEPDSPLPPCPEAVPGSMLRSVLDPVLAVHRSRIGDFRVA
jgi:acetoin utilization deacetylase AcuC-like enzyme